MNNNLMRKLLCQEFCTANRGRGSGLEGGIGTVKGYSHLDKSKRKKGNKGVEFIRVLKTELEEANNKATGQLVWVFSFNIYHPLALSAVLIGCATNVKPYL